MSPDILGNDVAVKLEETSQAGHHYKLDFKQPILTEHIVLIRGKENKNRFQLAGFKVFVEGYDGGKIFHSLQLHSVYVLVLRLCLCPCVGNCGRMFVFRLGVYDIRFFIVGCFHHFLGRR